MNALITGSMVLVSALLPSKALTMSGNPSWPVSRPMVDLRLQAALPGEPGLAEPVARAGLEVQRGGVVEHEAGRAEPGVRGAGRRQPLPPRLFRVSGQPSRGGAVGSRRDARLLQDPDAVQLAHGLDDPGQHQVPEHLVPAGRVLEPEHPVRMLEGVEQAAHPLGGDRQQRPAALPGRLQAQVKLPLPGGHLLTSRGLQRLQLGPSWADPMCSMSRDPRRDE